MNDINLAQDIRDLALLVKDARFNGYLPTADYGLIFRVETWLVAWPHPDWSRAPDWAQWWAVDCDGRAYWHTDEPWHNWHAWISHGKSYGLDLEIEIPLGIDWRVLKEKRP